MVSGVYIAVFLMLGIYKSFNGMNYMETLIYFGKLVLYYGSYVLLKSPYKNYFWASLYLTNIIMQIFLLDRFSLAKWVG